MGRGPDKQPRKKRLGSGSTGYKRYTPKPPSMQKRVGNAFNSLKSNVSGAAAGAAAAAKSAPSRVRSAAGTASRIAKSDAANVVGGFKKGGFKTGMRTLAGSRTGRVAGAAGLVGAGAGIAAYINNRRKRNR